MQRYTEPEASATRHVILVGLAWTVVTLALIALAVAAPLFPAAASKEARIVDGAFLVLLVVSVPVFALVEVVVVYSALRFRATGDEDGPPVEGGLRVSASWIAVTLVMVLGLAAFGWVGMNELQHAHERPDLVVRVTGKQFAWQFEYPSLGVKTTELRVPKDRLVRFELESPDVLHSFWIPAFRVKQDVVPGRTIAITATPTEVGRYEILCAELCGVGHTIMKAPVQVMDQVAFDAWASTAKALAR